LRLQVVGGKGYGKSTLLNAVARQVLKQSASGITKLLPVYCQVSESMYKREPKELSELFYNKMWEEISALSGFTVKSLKERVLSRIPSDVSKDVAEATASAAIGIYNPLLSVIIPIAKRALEAAWRKYQSIKPSPSLSTLVEDFIENASANHVKPVLLIDELDKADSQVLISFFAAERRFFESENRIIVLATSGGIAEQIEYAGGVVREIHREFEHLFRMDRLPNVTEATQIVYKRLIWAAHDGTSFEPTTIFPSEIIERLHYVSGGIPSALMQICFQTLENAIQTGARSVRIEHLPFFVEEMNNAERYLATLGASHKKVLKFALSNYGITASDLEIQKQARVTRSRLAQILGVLSKKGVLTGYKEGLYKYYKMTEYWKGVLQQLLRINPKALD